MTQISFSPEQKKTYSRFRAQYPDEEIGIISLYQKYGYFYLVPMSDRFYQSEHFCIPTLEHDLDAIDLGETDTKVFSNLNPTWIDSVARALGGDLAPDRVLFLDIGAFVGSVSLHLKTDKRASEWRIHTFEPNPFNYELLNLNLVLNNCSSVQTINSACSNSNGSVEFWVPSSAKISGRIGSLNNQESFSVNATTVESYIVESRVDFHKAVLKIDTEGFEWQVLTGVSASIFDRVLCAIVEYWPTKTMDFEKFLLDRFHVFAINSTMFSASPPYKVFDSPQGLHDWAQEYIAQRNNVDILLTPKRNTDVISERLNSLMSESV